MRNGEPIFDDTIATIALVLGVTISPVEYAGGVLMAMCGAGMSFIRDENAPDRRSYMWCMFAAFVLATIVASLDETIFPDIAPQVKMFLAGFFARPIVIVANAVSHRVMADPLGVLSDLIAKWRGGNK